MGPANIPSLPPGLFLLVILHLTPKLGFPKVSWVSPHAVARPSEVCSILLHAGCGDLSTQEMSQLLQWKSWQSLWVAQGLLMMVSLLSAKPWLQKDGFEVFLKALMMILQH